MTWDDALQTFLAEPIEASTLESLPDQMAYYRTAIGHVPDGNGDFQVAPIPFLPRSNGPAGSTPYGAARDVLQLAKLHLAGGRAPDGSQVLSEASAQAMQESQVAVPPAMTPDEWGLGWMLFDWDGRRLIGHDGSTLGQNSYLRIVPDDGVAVVVMANGGNAAALYRRIVGAVLDPLTSIAVPPLPEATGHTIDPSRYLGVYERLAHRMVIELRGDELWMSAIELRPFNPEAPEAPEAQLHPVDDHLFVYTTPDSGFRNQLSFGDPDEDGRFTWAFMGRRLPRVS